MEVYHREISHAGWGKSPGLTMPDRERLRTFLKQLAQHPLLSPGVERIRHSRYANPLGNSLKSALSTTAVEFQSVEILPPNGSLILNAKIDLPASHTRHPAYVIRIEGWVLTGGQKPTGIEIYWKDLRMNLSRSFVERPDVTKHFQQLPDSLAVGFSSEVDTLLFPEQFELLVKICFEDGAKEPIGVIRGRRRNLVPGFTPTIQPIAVYGLGRSGTTLLMRYLSNHPQVVAYDRYPYEMRIMSYFLQVMGVLSSRADHINSAHPTNFYSDQYRVGFNPFYAPMYGGTVEHWFNQHYLEELATFSLRSIDSFYQTLAASQQKRGVVYFAEKVVAVIRNQYQWTLYPGGRAILLMRDLRDRHSSVLAFNEKRGFNSFGYQANASHEKFLENTHRAFSFDMANWRQHPDQVRLIRYEDLIMQPHETLLKIVDHLGVENSSSVIKQMIALTQTDTSELEQHRTSEDAQHSIGRWKTDLDPQIAALYRERFGDVLAELGYEV
jgi:hypothetical protein